jgi:hypothetical protein
MAYRTWLTLQPDASLADLNELLTLRHIERNQIGFHTAQR